MTRMLIFYWCVVIYASSAYAISTFQTLETIIEASNESGESVEGISLRGIKSQLLESLRQSEQDATFLESIYEPDKWTLTKVPEEKVEGVAIIPKRSEDLPVSKLSSQSRKSLSELPADEPTLLMKLLIHVLLILFKLIGFDIAEIMKT